MKNLFLVGHRTRRNTINKKKGIKALIVIVFLMFASCNIIRPLSQSKVSDKVYAQTDESAKKQGEPRNPLYKPATWVNYWR